MANINASLLFTGGPSVCRDRRVVEAVELSGRAVIVANYFGSLRQILLVDKRLVDLQIPLICPLLFTDCESTR